MKSIKRFLKSDDGAVTVDWVVLTAAIIGLAIFGFGAFRDVALAIANALSSQMSSVVVSVF
ncbi:hypothetical protein [Epibacterium ulvae]|uniref:hypothetical protein n=1 Tax=Epibacterium ulvae TaxID=1156985 RepID=UPI0024928B6B|nr:hypothetical protein [Epibacterium ulvae]